MDMLIFVQVCMTIDKNLVSFYSSIGSGRTNEEQMDLYKNEACVARKVMKERGSKEKRF